MSFGLSSVTGHGVEDMVHGGREALRVRNHEARCTGVLTVFSSQRQSQRGQSKAREEGSLAYPTVGTMAAKTRELSHGLVTRPGHCM